MTGKIREIDESLSIRGGELYIEGCRATRLVELFGSPLFVVSEDQLRRNLNRYRKAFESRWSEGPVNILPAIKANTSLATRKVLTEEGAGCDVFSPGELYAALKTGTKPELISVNGGGKSAAHIRNCIKSGVRITVDDIDEIDLIEREARGLRKKAWIRLRLRPDFPNLWQPTGFANEMAPIDLGFQIYKSGIPTEHVYGIGKRAIESPHLELVGLHLHIGRHHYRMAFWRGVIKGYVKLIAELREKWGGWLPKELDIGGGIPSPRDPFGQMWNKLDELMYFVFWFVLILLKLLGTRLRYKIVSAALGLVMEKKQRNRKIPSIEQYAEEITTTLRRAFKKYKIDPKGMAIQIEPGRSLYGNASVHLSKVLSTKYQRSPIAYNWVILDTSYFFLTGGVIEQNFYNFLVANKADAKAVKFADICGRSCFADRLVPEVRIPDIKAGDVIAVLDTGAYQENSASNFNSMPRPASVMVKGNTAAVIKRAETEKDVFARDIIPKKMIRVV